MSADLLALLDQLEEAREKATPGPWHVATSGGIDAGDYDTVIGRGDVDCMAYCYGGTSTLEGDNLPADAALIVAEHNALPKLTAALRVVVEAVDEWERNAETSDGRIPRWLVASVLRGAIADALTPEPVQP